MLTLTLICSDFQSHLWLQTNKAMKVFSRLCWVILHWLWKNNTDVCDHPLQEGRDKVNILTTNIQETMIISYLYDVGESNAMTENIPWSLNHCATALFQMCGGDNRGESLFFLLSTIIVFPSISTGGGSCPSADEVLRVTKLVLCLLDPLAGHYYEKLQHK